MEVRTLEPAEVAGHRARLAELLIDSVANGASVGFLQPLAAADAEAYWRGIERAVGEGKIRLLVAGPPGGPIAGTVQLDVGTMPNQPHRATISKLLVHSAARRQGIGEALMRAAERVALDSGRWLLVLDTATPEAERLYERLGWQVAGVVPDYALNPDRTLTPTTFYWKRLAR